MALRLELSISTKCKCICGVVADAYGLATTLMAAMLVIARSMIFSTEPVGSVDIPSRLQPTGLS